MKKILLLILFLTSSIPAFGQVDSTYEGKLSDLLIQSNKFFHFKYLGIREMGYKDFLIRYFVFENKKYSFSGGCGFEITKPGREKPIWYNMVFGDFCPHSIKFIDINRDGNMDIFFYRGQEDVYSTYLYLANFEKDTKISFSPDNYMLVYANDNEYSILVDLDGDNHPEILDSGYAGDKNMSGLSCLDDPTALTIQEKNSITITESVKDKITKKYHQITGKFDIYNFDYNLPEVYPIANSFLLSPIKIYVVKKQYLFDVTSKYPKYLKWRINILRQIKKNSSEKCTDGINQTIKYLNMQMAK